MRKMVLVLAAVAVIMGTSLAMADNVDEEYPGTWSDSFNMDISRTLAKNNISGCGEYEYKPHKDARGEFLVRCDNRYYMVWIYLGQVDGPFSYR